MGEYLSNVDVEMENLVPVEENNMGLVLHYAPEALRKGWMDTVAEKAMHELD